MKRTCISTAATRHTRAATDKHVGTIKVRPSWATTIAVKIGLRTNAKRPPVTSSVRSVSLTPMRQDEPIPV